jgi:regulator of sigma E protease
LGGYAKIAGMEGGPENPDLDKAAAYLAHFGTLNLAEVQKSGEVLGFDLESALDILDIWGTAVRTRLPGGDYLYQMPEVGGYALGEPRPIGDPKTFIDSERRETYRGLSWWKRMLILFAGAGFNLIFAILVTAAVLMASGANVFTTTIDTVSEDSAAAQAGIVSGDVVVSIDGTPIEGWEALTVQMAGYAPGDTITLVYEHNGTQGEANLTLGNSEGRAVIGIIPVVEHRSVGLFEALGTAFGYIGLTVGAIIQLFNPMTFNSVVEQSTSLIGIFNMADQAATAGPMPILMLVAILSISIGLMNLLPIPPLDGGKMIVETIERISKRHVPVKVVNGISIAGMALIMLLFIVVTTQDIQRFILAG